MANRTTTALSATTPNRPGRPATHQGGNPHMKTPKRHRARHPKPAATLPTRGIVLGAVNDLFEALLAELGRTGL